MSQPDWEYWKLAHAYPHIGSGTTPTASVAEFYNEDEGIPWVTTSELRETYISRTRTRVTKEALSEFSALRVFPENSVMMAMYGATIGRLGQTKIKTTCNQACCVFPESEQFNNRFLFYWLWHRRGDLIALSVGGGQPNLSQHDLREEKALCPPVETQKKIAAFLDEKTTQIDGLIEKKYALLERLAEKRQALITQAVTKGLNPTAPMKDSGIDWLGQVPEHWVLRPLWAICKITTGYAFDSNDFGPEGVPVVRISDVKPSGKVDVGNSKCIDKEASEKFLRYMVGSGDILMAMTGATVGKAAIYCLDEPALLNQRVAAFRAIVHLSQSFLWFLMNSSSYLDYVTLTAYGGAQPNISDKQLLDFRFALPGAKEQTEIASFLGHECTKIDAAYQNVLVSVSTLEEYRAALISSAVTGKLDGLQ